MSWFEVENTVSTFCNAACHTGQYARPFEPTLGSDPVPFHAMRRRVMLNACFMCLCLLMKNASACRNHVEDVCKCEGNRRKRHLEDTSELLETLLDVPRGDVCT